MKKGIHLKKVVIFIGGGSIEAFRIWERGKCLLLWIAVLASPLVFSADAQKGQTLYQNCISCHGTNGEGNLVEKAPRVAGQHDWYIISSIKAFQLGKERKHPQMLPYIKNLSDRDIEDLAAYLSGLAPL